MNYDEISFAPRFPVTHYEELRYITGYEVSKALVDVRWIKRDEGMRYDITSPAKKLYAHFLMPKGKKCKELLVNGVSTAFTESKIGDSEYVDISFENLTEKKMSFEIIY